MTKTLDKPFVHVNFLRTAKVFGKMSVGIMKGNTNTGNTQHLGSGF